LESDFDACGSGFLSVALTEEQEGEAKELYRVLFLVLQDPDALKTLSFDKITNEKVRRYLKHVRLGKDGPTIFVTHKGEDYILAKFEDRERIIKDTHCNAHFPMRPTHGDDPKDFLVAKHVQTSTVTSKTVGSLPKVCKASQVTQRMERKTASAKTLEFNFS